VRLRYTTPDHDTSTLVPTTTTSITTTTTPTPTTTTSTTLPPGSQSIQVRVSTGSDDAEQAPDGTVDNGNSDLELVVDGSDVQQVGLRFASVAIPPGATIVNAYVQFQVDEVTTAGTVAVTLAGQASNNAPTFAETDNNISSRTRTAHTVPWTIPGWTPIGAAGTAQRTPNIASIIQDIVNVGGW
jgi:hypothetical protein